MTGYSSKTFAQKLRSLLRMPRKLADKGDDISEALNPRYAACSILYNAAVPYCIWCEDALSAYGVPTIVFDLFLLTPDPGEAAATLIEAGYVRKEPNARFCDIPQFSNRLGPATSCKGDRKSIDKSGGFESLDPSMTEVVLLPANEWFYDLLEDAEDMTQWKPPLSKLLDSLMAKWFDLKDSDSEYNLQSHIAIFISYIYLYVGEVKEPGFERGLLKEHWQLHFDLAAGITGGGLNSSRCHHHYRSIKDKIRTGEHEPQSPQARGNPSVACYPEHSAEANNP
ncbi:MAG: hypothetical protein M1839_001757 [Geoglossum umbratile]|nr:MAG: hypothetical protein M1839_001757 [Geoglossum umbratile]